MALYHNVSRGTSEGLIHNGDKPWKLPVNEGDVEVSICISIDKQYDDKGTISGS